MKISVKENREIIMINAKNTQNENDVEVLHLVVPEKYNDFNKKIVFITPNGVVWDLIEGDTYTLKRAITQYEKVDFYIWLTKGEQDFRSVERTLILNKNHRVDGEVTPEEETDMERVISILESEITKVDNLNIDINKVGSTTTVTLTDKNGNEKSVEILDGKDGDGRDGFSPIITETQTANGYNISITDKNGTNVISLLNGQDGIAGATGATGATGNGISSITKTGTSGLTDTYTILYTNGNSTTFDVKNGANGQNGSDGQDGYTPVRGTDYWTSADIASIEQYCASYIDANITQAIGGSY